MESWLRRMTSEPRKDRMVCGPFAAPEDVVARPPLSAIGASGGTVGHGASSVVHRDMNPDAESTSRRTLIAESASARFSRERLPISADDLRMLGDKASEVLRVCDDLDEVPVPGVAEAIDVGRYAHRVLGWARGIVGACQTWQERGVPREFRDFLIAVDAVAFRSGAAHQAAEMLSFASSLSVDVTAQDVVTAAAPREFAWGDTVVVDEMVSA